MMAYASLYREVEVVLDQASRHDVPVILISDDLGPSISDNVAEILLIPRGKVDHLAGHRRETAFDSLDHLSTLRGSIDKAWSKRGTKKKK